MSDKRRRKLERRQKRQQKRARQQALHQAKHPLIECPNCGDAYRTESRPDEFHRPGPCDCTPEIRKVMNDFLEVRSSEYEKAPGGKIACRSCSAMHDEDNQCTIFVEGRLVWDGCLLCRDTKEETEIEKAIDAARLRWTKSDAKAIEESAKAHEKYVAPFQNRPPVPRSESIRDSSPHYQGSFIRPQGR
jgi:hypothetical protein